MPTGDVRLYAAFAASRFGGNIAGVVYVGDLTDEEMQAVAADLAAPTTGFVSRRDEDTFDVRFFSSRCEMAMCGHATVGVFAALFDDGIIEGRDCPYVQATAAGDVPVVVQGSEAGPLVTLRQGLPRFDGSRVEPEEIAPLIGLAPGDVVSVEAAAIGLRHVFVEVRGVEILGRARPDDDGLRRLAAERGVDTFGVWSLGTAEGARAELRLRDFCHGVGDPEEAASGTTNGALACLLSRNGIVAPGRENRATVVAEQGVEMGRPSRLETTLRFHDGCLRGVEVAGRARRRLSGSLHI